MKQPNEWRDNLLGRLQRAGVDIEPFKNNADAALDRLVHEIRMQLPPPSDDPFSDGERMPTGTLLIDDDFRIEGGVADLTGGGEFPVLMLSLAPHEIDNTLHLVFTTQKAFRDFGHAVTDGASLKAYPEEQHPVTNPSIERFLQALRNTAPK